MYSIIIAALTFIPRQPVKFLEAGEEDFNTFNKGCTWELRTFCQLVDITNPTNFQVMLTPIDGAELLTNADCTSPVGWTFGGTGWTHDGVANEFDHAAGTAGDLSQNVLKNGSYYRVTLTVKNYVAGTIEVRLGGTTVGTPTSDGTYTYYGFSGGTTFAVNATSPADVSVTDFNLVEMSIPTPYLRLCDGTYVQGFTLQDMTFFEDHVLISVDWSNSNLTSPECYEICIGDGAAGTLGGEVIPDPGFANACGVDWTCTGSVSIGGGKASFVPGSPPGNLSDDISITGGCYILTFDISAASTPNPDDFYFDITIAGVVVVHITDVSDAVGFHTVLINNLTGSGIDITVEDNVTLTLESVSLKEVTAGCSVNCSECFSLKDTHDCNKTKTFLLEAQNNDNFNLSGGKLLEYANITWKMKVRLKGILDMLNFPYPAESQYKDSSGVYSTLYVESEVHRELLIQDIPPYLHECVSLMFAHDTKWIDGVEYTKLPGDYEPDIVDRRETRLAPATVTVFESDQGDVNKNC